MARVFNKALKAGHVGFVTDAYIQCIAVYKKIGPVHEVSNNVVCKTSKDSDQPAHMRSLIRAYASRLSSI